MSGMPAWMCIYDLETTGTDEERDKILEVGAILTGSRPETFMHPEYTSRFQRAVAIGIAGWKRLADNDFVRRMHEKSGLLDEGLVRLPAVQVDADLTNWIRAQTRSDAHAISAGSGVAHFDRRFVKKHLPRFDRLLTHWSLDVGVIRRACDLTERRDLILEETEELGKNHRAMVDAEFHAKEIGHYLTVLAFAMPPLAANVLEDCAPPEPAGGLFVATNDLEGPDLGGEGGDGGGA